MHVCDEQVLEQLEAQSLAPTACTTIEEVGSTGVGALTIAFLILGVSTIVFITRVGSAKGQKVYYYCNVFVCGLATMAYFAMLSGQGWTAVAGCRQFFYARYVDWSITTPLLLLDLGLIAGADGALIAAVVGADREFQLLLAFLLACIFTTGFLLSRFYGYHLLRCDDSGMAAVMPASIVFIGTFSDGICQIPGQAAGQFHRPVQEVV